MHIHCAICALLKKPGKWKDLFVTALALSSAAITGSWWNAQSSVNIKERWKDDNSVMNHTGCETLPDKASYNNGPKIISPKWYCYNPENVIHGLSPWKSSHSHLHHK